MYNLSFYFIQALWIVWRKKNLWLLGFVQQLCLFLVLRRINPFWWQNGFKIFWQLGLVLLFSLSSVMLWLQIKADLQRKVFTLPAVKFLNTSLRVFLTTLFAIFVAMALKVFHMHWTFFALFSDLLSVSTGMAVLAMVLYNLNILRSGFFVWDFWRLKPSVLFSISFIVLIAHGFAYYFAHAFIPAMPASIRLFPVYVPSATIWMLFLGLCLAIAFLAAFLNTIAVIFFLSSNEPKKSSEEVEEGVIQPVGNV